MASKDDKLATFRIDSHSWERFKNWASSNNSSASAVLLNLIDRCLAGEITASSITNKSQNLDNLDSLIDERIEAKLNQLETKGSQPHPDNLDAILDERDRHLESRLLSILETMLVDKLDDKLEEIQGNVSHIELALDKRIDKLELSHPAASMPVGMEALATVGKWR